MALKGTLKFYEVEDDLENPQTHEVTFGELPENHKYYEHSNSTATITEYPEKEVLVREEKDCYVVIDKCSLHLLDSPAHEHKGEKHWNVQYTWKLFFDEQARENDFFDELGIFQSKVVHIYSLTDNDLSNKNLLQWSYEHLSQQRGFEDMISV